MLFWCFLAILGLTKVLLGIIFDFFGASQANPRSSLSALNDWDDGWVTVLLFLCFFGVFFCLLCCLCLRLDNRTRVFAFFVVAINLGSRWCCCVDDCFVDDFKVVMRMIERCCTVRCSVEKR